VSRLSTSARRTCCVLNTRKWVVGIIVFASCVQVFLQIIWQNIFYAQFNWNNLQAANLLYTLINWLVIFTVWTAMYLLYRFIENERETEIQELKLQALQNEIELNQLKSQLNPHFLFNALNGIRALINENTNVAREAVTRLSEMLRQTFLFGKRNTVSLEEEINLVKDYLAIEKLRFEERLEVKYTIDENCKVAQIPPFIIQTIAENAIKHGISKLTSGGIIGIEIKKDGELILIEIRNSGKLASKSKHTLGIGWENCKKRLNLLYGKNASFEVMEENNEVICNFKIPFLN
jgi:LytS/YehU family sensor histidine kinase